MQLNQIRKQINEIDTVIESLLEKRMVCASLVAEAKEQSAKEQESVPVIFVKEREDEILAAVNSGEHTDAVRYLMQEIMGTSRRHQYRLLTQHGVFSESVNGSSSKVYSVLILPGKLTEALQIVCRYQVQILSVDEEKIFFYVDEVLEAQALCNQLFMEHISKNT